MDDSKTKARPQEESAARPSTDREDLTPQYLYTTVQAYNDFLLRLERLKSYHPDWDNPRNQSRPFKRTFMEFLKNLVLRLPYTPEMLPAKDGTVLLKFKKINQPRHKWQSMEVIIFPTRHFAITAKSRIPTQKPFMKSNMARPDVLSDIVKAFFEYDTINTKEHPIRYRYATVVDYPYISALFQSTFGIHPEYHPSKISKLLQFCAVADDPIYGIVAVAAIKECDRKEDADFEVSALLTLETYRSLGFASKCLRKALTKLLVDYPRARVLAKPLIADGTMKDACQSALRRAGFKRFKVVRGERKYRTFDCDRCNTRNGYCVFEEDSSCCSTAYYMLNDYGGKMGYGGGKVKSTD